MTGIVIEIIYRPKLLTTQNSHSSIVCDLFLGNI